MMVHEHQKDSIIDRRSILKGFAGLSILGPSALLGACGNRTVAIESPEFLTTEQLTIVKANQVQNRDDLHSRSRQVIDNYEQMGFTEEEIETIREISASAQNDTPPNIEVDPLTREITFTNSELDRKYNQIGSAPFAEIEEAHYLHHNAIRLNSGLEPLARIQELDHLAADWSAHMSTIDDMIHDPAMQQGLELAWAQLGENVGTSRLNQEGLSRVLQAFVESPGHLANIIDPTYTHMGVAATPGLQDNRFYVTLRFLAAANRNT